MDHRGLTTKSIKDRLWHTFWIGNVNDQFIVQCFAIQVTGYTVNDSKGKAPSGVVPHTIEELGVTLNLTFRADFPRALRAEKKKIISNTRYMYIRPAWISYWSYFFLNSFVILKVTYYNLISPSLISCLGFMQALVWPIRLDVFESVFKL